MAVYLNSTGDLETTCSNHLLTQCLTSVSSCSHVAFAVYALLSELVVLSVLCLKVFKDDILLYLVTVIILQCS